METNNEEMESSPLLNSLPKQDPFVVPAGFFERFPQSFSERLTERPSFMQRLLAQIVVLQPSPRLALGSVLAVLALGFVFWFQEPAEEASEQSLVAQEFPMEPIEWQDAELFALSDESSELWASVGSDISTTELEAFVENEDLDLELLNELL